MTLEAKCPFFYTILKIKLESMGFDPSTVGLIASYVSGIDRYDADTISLSYWKYRFTDYFIMWF